MNRRFFVEALLACGWVVVHVASQLDQMMDQQQRSDFPALELVSNRTIPLVAVGTLTRFRATIEQGNGTISLIACWMIDRGLRPNYVQSMASIA